MENFLEKIKNWFKSMFNAVKSALSNFKLWFVKNIDFIKKCLCVVLLGLFCIALIPFSCRSCSTAKADTLDTLTDTAVVYNIGSYYPRFNVGSSGGAAVNLNLKLSFGLEFDYYSNSVYMLLPSDYRIDLTGVTDIDGSTAVVLPSVFTGDIYSNVVQSSFIVLSITNTELNVIEEDFLGSPQWVVSFRPVTATSFNIIFENSNTGGGVVFTAFLTYQNVIRDYSNNLIDSYTVSPLIYLLNSGGYDEGYSTGYDEGYSTGYDEGAVQGYQNALNDGSSGGVFGGFVSAVNSFFDIQLIGNVTIANVLQIGFGIILLGFIIKIFLGG